MDLLKLAFNLKILSGVTLLKVKLGVTWTQPIYYLYIIKRAGWVVAGWQFFNPLPNTIRYFGV